MRKRLQTIKKTLELRPDSAQVYKDMAAAQIWQGDYGAAIEACEKAVALKDDYAEAYNTMASAMMMQGEYEESIKYFNKAIQLEPNHAMAHFNLALVLLLIGRFEQGWEEYEWRLKNDKNIQQSRWDGSAFKGKRLLICSEQGLGDSLQFVRYLPMVKELGGTVYLLEKKPLLSLFSKLAGVDNIVEDSSKSNITFDYHIPLLSLPGIFNTTLENIPAKVPYIYADKEKSQYWKKQLSGDGFKVGIVWSGAVGFKNNHHRSCKLINFLPLSKIDGIRLYSLQKGPPIAELESLANGTNIIDLGSHFNDFSDTAAAIENLDLIISTDTSVLHLAGAMGKNVWALLMFVPDWRWLLEREDNPWYPTMKLFRQKNQNDWDELFARVGIELENLVKFMGI